MSDLLFWDGTDAVEVVRESYGDVTSETVEKFMVDLMLNIPASGYEFAMNLFNIEVLKRLLLHCEIQGI